MKLASLLVSVLVATGAVSAAGAPRLDLDAVPVAAPSFSRLPAGWRAFASRLFGRLGSLYDLEVRVDITSHHPSADQLRRARQVVAGLTLPKWPTPANC